MKKRNKINEYLIKNKGFESIVQKKNLPDFQENYKMFVN